MSETKKYSVCVVTGTRADYGVLRPLLIRLRDCPEIDLNLVATGREHAGGTEKRRIFL